MDITQTERAIASWNQASSICVWSSLLSDLCSSFKAPEMNLKTQTSLTLETSFERRNPTSAQSSEHQVFLRGILEGMPDGIMIVAGDGTVLQSNSKACVLCRKLDSHASSQALPLPVRRLCDALLDSCKTFTDDEPADAFPYLTLEDDIEVTSTKMIRVRVQWLDQETSEAKMLVILEDRYQTARSRAIAEGQRYGLSNRESEVWLYRCVGYTYKQIASELFITTDTVKKHVKSINVKRDRFHCLSYESA